MAGVTFLRLTFDPNPLTKSMNCFTACKRENHYTTEGTYFHIVILLHRKTIEGREGKAETIFRAGNLTKLFKIMENN